MRGYLNERNEHVKKRLSTGRKVAFVFGGGGSRGAVQVGMVKALYDQGILPDIVTGVSIGALNGFFVAQDDIDAMESWWRTIKRTDDVLRRRFMSSLLMYCGWQWGSPSLFTPGPLANKLYKQIRNRNVSRFQAELRVGAVDLNTGEYVSVNQEHPLLDRFLGGCTAIPLAFPPVPISRRTDPELAGLYVDGCVRNMCPISEAIKLGATEIHVLLTGSSKIQTREVTYTNWKDIVSRTVDISMHEMFMKDIEGVLVRNDLAELQLKHNTWIPGSITGKPKVIDLRVYHTHETPLPSLLDFDPQNIAKSIKLGYKFGGEPVDHKSLSEDIKYGHQYVDSGASKPATTAASSKWISLLPALVKLMPGKKNARGTTGSVGKSA